VSQLILSRRKKEVIAFSSSCSKLAAIANYLRRL
jgi:hypothetical protein